MAKNKGGGRGKAPAAGKGRAKKAVRKAAGGKVKRAAPRSVPLPGLEQVRNTRLDNLCEAISEDRRTMAAARADEQGSIQAALREMKQKNIGAHKHAGVELAFVPGQDKLRVRLTKDSEDSSTSFEGGPADGGDVEEAPDGGDLGDDPDGDAEAF